MKDKIVIVGFIGILATFMFMIHDARSYEIGEVGPEGGTITDIQSSDQVTGTDTQITADGYEVTTTTTETTTIIYENVDNEVVTTTTTTSTTEGVSSGDVINESSCFGTTTGSTLDHCAHVHMDYQGGTWDFEINLADYLDSTEWTDGFNINQSIYGYACTNQIGGHCSSGTLDPLTVTITVTDPSSGESYQSAETFYLDNTWKYYESSMSVEQNNLGSGTTIDLSYYGVDAGYWGGWYGPVLQYPELEIIDTQITTITQQITQIVTEQVLTTLTTYEDTVVRNYIGSTTTPTVDVTSDPTSPASPTSVVSTASTPSIQVNVATPTATVSSFSMDASPMSMSSPSDSGGSSSQSSDSGGSTESSSSTSSSPSSSNTKTASNDSKSSSGGSKSESKSDSKSEESKSEGGSSEESKTEVANAIAQRIVADIASGTGDQAAALAAMASLGAKLVDASLFDAANFYVGEDIYINKTIKDVYGVAFSYAQDQLHNEMVEQQYK